MPIHRLCSAIGEIKFVNFLLVVGCVLTKVNKTSKTFINASPSTSSKPNLVRGENVKGVNLKKMGAILAGTAILAGSVAFAGQTMYENVELVNAQGQPVAKVVVGSNAALSDALSAARIAQTLANNAFVEKTYTAQVEGTDALTCGVDSGEATCTVTDSSVTLEVTVPGVAGTAVHEFGLLIGETTDKDLGDRDNTNDGLTKATGLLKD